MIDAGNMRIMVFLHGTTIMQKTGLGRTRGERVQQVMDREESVCDFASYIPIDDAVVKLRKWQEQGADIFYVTFRQKAEDVEVDKSVLAKHGFPDGLVLFRHQGEGYRDLAEKLKPDVLIEDDCQSIGGNKQTISAQLTSDVQRSIRAITVREFEGIDHLADDLSELKQAM
ncbi:unnamed protein product [marine sediment metagenome]|uniref:Uncharacterized protein n=1 Tax=marine sediment metagenome TaxID=412755 RepID=X0XDV8_9ZZZZ